MPFVAGGFLLGAKVAFLRYNQRVESKEGPVLHTQGAGLCLLTECTADSRKTRRDHRVLIQIDSPGRAARRGKGVKNFRQKLKDFWTDTRNDEQSPFHCRSYAVEITLLSVDPPP